MRIKVIYDPEFKCLKIPVVLKAPRKRIPANIIFDTGSPHTILNYTDSIRLGIPHNNKSEIIRIGGGTYQSYSYENFEIILKSEKGETTNEAMNIRVIKPLSLKSEELEKLDRFPNLLGIDFLELGYIFFCDLKTKEIYFDKQKEEIT